MILPFKIYILNSFILQEMTTCILRVLNHLYMLKYKYKFSHSLIFHTVIYKVYECMENLLLVVDSIHYTNAGIMSHEGQQLSTGRERDILNPSTWKYSHKNSYKFLWKTISCLSSSTVNLKSYFSLLVFHSYQKLFPYLLQ